MLWATWAAIFIALGVALGLWIARSRVAEARKFRSEAEQFLDDARRLQAETMAIQSHAERLVERLEA